jgi:hypothetical protein
MRIGRSAIVARQDSNRVSAGGACAIRRRFHHTAEAAAYQHGSRARDRDSDFAGSAANVFGGGAGPNHCNCLAERHFKFRSSNWLEMLKTSGL